MRKKIIKAIKKPHKILGYIKNKIEIRYKNYCIIKNFNPNDTEYGLNRNKRNNLIIVSFTTIPSRIHKCVYVVDSMLKQSLKPDKLILYLGIEQFKDKDLPVEFINLQKRGLEIKYVEDLKPHTKYFYTIQEFKNEIVITVDDDIIYPNNLIEILHNSYKKYPNAVSCMRAHRMLFDGEMLLPYNSWEMESNYTDKPAFDLLATGVGGVLYPPLVMSGEVFNIKNIKELCFKQDDIWLKVMQLLNNTPVVLACVKKRNLIEIKNTQETALCKTNVGLSQNDVYIKNVFDRYNVCVKDKRVNDK